MLQRRVRIGEVAVGQPLPWNVYNSSGVLLLAKGFPVSSEQQLNRLLTSGFYNIEPTQAWRQPPLSALQYVLHACYRLGLLFEQPERIHNFPEQVLEVARLIEQGYRRAPGVVIATVVLRRSGRYVVRHSVNAACVAVAVLHEMNPTGPIHLPVLAAALTMNIGVLELQEILAQQPQPLTPSQQARIEHHPFDSVQRLRKLGVCDELWLRVVQEHHEALDGGGYPLRLRGAAVAQEAQLIGLADVFCARVSERSYRQADSAKLVLRDILIERGRRADVILAAYFIRALGVYPIGTVVQLVSGEIGVVSGHSAWVDAPIVHALLTAEGSRLALPVRYETHQPEHAIAEALSISELDIPIDMEAIWGAEASDFHREQQDPNRPMAEAR
jgi:hypothetical protein